MKKKKLLKDIVIPVGTIFTCVSGRTSQFGYGMIASTIGLTPDSCGEFVYGFDEEDKALNEWFEDIE